MDNATKRDLKQQDQFVTTTQHGLDWASRNRKSAWVTAGLLLVLILAAVGGFAWYNHRSNAASVALGAAMQVYQTPVTAPGQQVPPGTKTFASAADRAKASNGMFLDVASHYGMLKDGKIARYFAGLTYMEEGQNKSAEDTLKDVSGSFDKDLASLAKVALAQLYRETGRNSDAANLYQELTKTDASTVPAGMAQIQLAEMYTADGKDAEAKKIYAQLKDKDKDEKGNPGPIGALAAEKLNPSASGVPRR